MGRCRDQPNSNLAPIPGQYLGEKLPHPHSIDVPSSIWDIRPEAVPYHRKRITQKLEERLIVKCCAFVGSCSVNSTSGSFAAGMNGPFLCHCPTKSVGVWYYGKDLCSSVDGLEKVTPFIQPRSFLGNLC